MRICAGPFAIGTTLHIMKKTFGWIIAAVAILGSAPLLLRITNVYFVPSENWLNAMSWPASIFGIVLGILLAFFVVKTRDSNPKLQEASLVKVGFIGFGTFLLMWMLGFMFVAVSIPMAHAGLLGEETSLGYTVEEPYSSGSRGCRPATKLANMSFLVDELCGTPRELTEMLSEGGAVYAIGRGTALGVFYDSFSLFE